MSTQAVFLLLIGLFVLYQATKFLRTLSVTQYSPQQLSDRLSRDPHVVLLDVRTESERTYQHIKGSLHIPLHELRRRAGEIRNHQEREIVCYCQSGSRSLSAALILKKHGFRAASLRGGIVDWNFTRNT